MTAAPERTALADLAPTDVDGRAAATLRLLAADAVQEAASGHPGLPMGMAVAGWTLWSQILRHDPAAPDWPDRDRFVLSAGHGSMLLYGLLHLTGYPLPRSELTRFRQWGSRTPGHPEHGHTVGVETTTGPLGQGLANAVGMALAERMLAARYNTAGHTVVDHRTWVLAGDGDLMEGISHEAASLAGHLGLGRLTVLFDDNRITIDGPTSLTCSDDVAGRFASYGWQVLTVEDANDESAVSAALLQARFQESRPTLIRLRSVIGYGSPQVAGTAKAHGAPLGPQECDVVRSRFGFPPGSRFYVPDDVAAAGAAVAAAGADERRSWERVWRAWRAANPELAREWDRCAAGELPEGVWENLPSFEPGSSVATRVASGRVVEALLGHLGELVGGSADLAGSTGVPNRAEITVRPGHFGGQLVHFGIREHAMAAMLNGLALHGGLRPFGSGFLVFSDYCRPSLRLAALMRVPVVFVFTHDSVAVGEDGPTHQPVEHVESLRLIPGLTVLRPADAHETVACWRFALESVPGPTVLVLSRQNLPVLAPPPPGFLATGAHAVRTAPGTPAVVLAASGSEVSLALRAAEELAAQGLAASVVSVPWREGLERAEPDQVAALFPAGVPVVTVEAGVGHGWRGWLAGRGVAVAVERFGASAPGETVYAQMGLTVERVCAAARGVVTSGGGADAS